MQTPIKNILKTIQEADDSVENLDIKAVNSLTSPIITEGLFNQVGRLTSDESYTLVMYYRLLQGTGQALKKLEEEGGSSYFSAQKNVNRLLDRNKEIVSLLEDRVD